MKKKSHKRPLLIIIILLVIIWIIVFIYFQTKPEVHKQYYENWQVSAQCTYKWKQKIWECMHFYENWQLKDICPVVGRHRVWTCTGYYENWVVEMIAEFNENGQAHWEWAYFDDEGYIERTETYVNWEHDMMPYVEAACEYSVGKVSEDEKWEKICVFSDDNICYLNDILKWTCESDLLWNETQERIDLYYAQFYCHDNGWKVQIADELCVFYDDSWYSWCDLVDYYKWRCNKWDVQYEEIDNLTWARNKCIEKNWQLSEDEKWNEVCVFENGQSIPTSETFLFWFDF